MVGSLVPLGVQPQCQQICAEVVANNPGKVRNVWGYHTTPDHNNRKCVDYMIHNTAGGDQIVKYYLDARERLLVDLIIWNRRIMRSYSKPGIPAWTWAPYTGKSPHTDHPHVQHKVGKYTPPSGGAPVDKPKNEEGIKSGDKVKVNATGGLRGRKTPGGSVEVTRPDGFEFTVKDVKDGWATGGQNWYSTDYLDKVKTVTPPVTPPKPKPSWSSKPVVTLAIPKIPGPVDHLQAVTRVAGGLVDGKKVADIYVLAQDPGNKGDTRFLAFTSGGGYINSMTVKNGGHGSTFHAYRSAAGNLYIWTLIGSVAYRIKWQPGKTITANSSGVDKMAYGTARPVGTYEHFVGFRAATDTKETFTIHDRFGFTDPKNNTSRPIRKVTVNKRTGYTQQTWAVSDTRIYRFMGKTNSDPPKGTRLHILDVLDWAGKLLTTVDLTAMAIPSTSDEPEGLTFTGTPGSVLAGKREGGAKENRSYPIWQLTNLP